MVTLNLPSMHCGGCVRSVTAVAREVDLPTQALRFETAAEATGYRALALSP